jgi:hypothetical protein
MILGIKRRVRINPNTVHWRQLPLSVSPRLCRGLGENGLVSSLNLGCATLITGNPGKAGG